MNRYDILLGKAPPGKPYTEATQTLTMGDLDKIRKNFVSKMYPILPQTPFMQITRIKRDEEKLNSWTSMPITTVMPFNAFLTTGTMV